MIRVRREDRSHDIVADAVSAERYATWRASTLGKELPTTPNPLSGRMADISKPLLQVTQEVAPDRLDAVLERGVPG